MRKLLASAAACAVLACAPAFAQDAQPARHLEGRLASGASYVFDVPAAWNGTVLLFSHGYSSAPGNPARNVARNEKDWLLAHGYALAGSSYARTGWAVEEAVPDQLATLDAFAAQVGKPKQTIAWGTSMGGLVTIALAEQHPARIDGALAMCASAAGTLGMMNAALDGAYVFKTLAAPDSSLPVLFDRAGDEGKADLAAWQRELDRAQATPAGRARIALAATLAQVPWADPAQGSQAGAGDAAQQALLYRRLPGATLLPRDDQQRRAGGNFSWNTGIDYAGQLAASGRGEFVRRLYQQAGISLEHDLAALAGAPRIGSDPAAVRYMRSHYAPNGAIARPMLLMQQVVDPLTLVELSGDYARMVRSAGRGALLREAYIERAGHCNFSPAETLAALAAVERRIEQDAWPDGGESRAGTAAAFNALAASLGQGASAFVDYNPPAFLRPCSGSEASCKGETSRPAPDLKQRSNP
jgi:pimeloyl-ACP methyl ester carboxylesterase